ncbi:MAG: RluA family pseudouridine synthase [Lachnospiraceae bacterium]|nr:RluA family pseudouridine synthase [Lachnospiraceae bacterium]
MHRYIEYKITPEYNGTKVEHFLRAHSYSKQNIVDLKKIDDGVFKNGVFSKMNEIVKEGDVLRIHITDFESSEHVIPVELPLDIVYEDEDIIVVNKPAHMPTHPSMSNYDNSLANALSFYFASKGEDFVFRCTNRLDRDTSGLTVVAKHFVSGNILSTMGSKKEIKREYLAIVEGNVSPEEGTIDAPISREEGSVIRRTIDFENGERAVTQYKVIEHYPAHSLVALRLETGRTHQIRVHMKHLGFPLIGDYLYNPEMTYMERQALHSHKLSFTHPMTGEALEFTAEMPADMQSAIDRISS